MSYYSRLASAIVNDLYAGLKGLHTNISISIELLEDEIVSERLQLIKEYTLKNTLGVKELQLSLNCIPVDCKDIEKCSKCSNGIPGTSTAHFEIPQLITDFGGVVYVGSTDMQEPFTVYTSMQQAKKHLYRTRRKNKPYVYIDMTPNENGMFDCFIFNAPFIKQITVIGVFKDLRLVEEFKCNCQDFPEQYTWLDTEILKRLTLKKFYYYRLGSPLNLPNDQAYRL